MKYLIISTYDSCYDWEIKDNTDSISDYEYDRGTRIEKFNYLCEMLICDSLYNSDIDTSEYDFVCICVNGSIEVLKDTVNR